MPRFDPPIDHSYGQCVDGLLAIAKGRVALASPLTPSSELLLQMFRAMLSRGISEEELRSIADSPITGSDQQAKDALESWVDSLDIATARVLCVSTDSNNADLWTRYGGNHTGAVFEFKHVPEKDTPLLAAVQVQYAEELPALGSGHEFLLYGGTAEVKARTCQAIFFTKREGWRCQNEWRALNWRPNEKAQYGDYRFFPEELASVQFGDAALPSFKNELSDVLSIRYPHCAIR